MSREFSVNRKKGYLFVRTTGSVSSSDIRKDFERVKQFCDEHKLYRVLVDHREVEYLPIMPSL